MITFYFLLTCMKQEIDAEDKYNLGWVIIGIIIINTVV